MDVTYLKMQGFTLIELIIVLILMSILAVWTVNQWPGLTLNLPTQAQQLANNIRYAQSLSMSTDQRYRLVILSSTTYQLTNSSGTAVIMAAGNTIVTLNSGITFGTLTNLPNNLVAFDGQGIPYVNATTPGTALSANGTIPLSANGQTTSVIITPQTGRVSLQ